jgi:hypothetical protein
MTHTTTVEDRLSAGNFKSVVATLDITGLDNANNEVFDAAAELGFDTVFGVSVLGVENADSYVVQWDHLETDLYVEGYGGTDPTAGTDVGEVRVRVDGDPGA